MNSILKEVICNISNYDLNNDFIFIKDKNLNYIYINKNFCNFFNISLENVKGKNDNDFMEDLICINKLKEGDLLTLENDFFISDEMILGSNFKLLRLKFKLAKDNFGILGLMKICN